MPRTAFPLQIASKALYDFSNQYPSLLGIPELRQAVARHSAAHQQIPCEWASDTLVTVGATEGIAAAFMGLVNPGDEVRQLVCPCSCMHMKQACVLMQTLVLRPSPCWL